MSRIQFTGTGQLRWLVTLSSVTAPTVAQITAGVNLTQWLRQDGLKRSVSGNTIDIADASSLYNTTDAGTRDGSFSATFYRDTVSGSDTAWTTLPDLTRGFFVVAPFGFSGAGTGTSKLPVANDRCEVWPGVIISRAPEDEGKDKVETFLVNFGVTSTPELSAVVAA
jgi:hypothetical protein